MRKLLSGMSLLGVVWGLVGGCQPDKVSKSAQAKLDAWFPGQYKVMGAESATNTNNLDLRAYEFLAQSRLDPMVQADFAWKLGAQDGGLAREAVRLEMARAQSRAQSSRQLRKYLLAARLKNFSCGLAVDAPVVVVWERLSPRNAAILCQQLCRGLSAFFKSDSKTYSANAFASVSWARPQARGEGPARGVGDLIEPRATAATDEWDTANTLYELPGLVRWSEVSTPEKMRAAIRLSPGNVEELAWRERAFVSAQAFAVQQVKGIQVEKDPPLSADGDTESFDTVRYRFRACPSGDACTFQNTASVAGTYAISTGQVSALSWKAR